MIEAHRKVHIEPETGKATFKLTLGIFKSLVGWQSEAASGVKARGLTHAEAKVAAIKFRKWIDSQEDLKT